MKKLIAILLSLTFVLSVSAFAITINDSDTRDVYATYQEASAADIVYSIDITWGDMHFNYKESSNGTWDPVTLKYTDSTVEGWYPANEATETSLASNEIKIVNRSNANVSCSFEFDDNDCDELRGGDHYFSLNGKEIKSNIIEINSATSGQATTELLALNLTGTPNDKTMHNANVGQITIEIASTQ